MEWTKIFHIIFICAWFAGLFYLPRIFVNLAMVPKDSVAERERLLLMSTKLFKFMTLMAIVAFILGIVLWLGWWKYHGYWIFIKLAMATLSVIYHFICYLLLLQFRKNTCKYSHIWFRWFNEIPLIFLIIAVAVTIFKPFQIIH